MSEQAKYNLNFIRNRKPDNPFKNYQDITLEEYMAASEIRGAMRNDLEDRNWYRKVKKMVEFEERMKWANS